MGKKEKIRREKRKIKGTKGETNDKKYFEECDARQSERKGKPAIARGTPYIRAKEEQIDTYLYHGQNNTKGYSGVH